MDQAETKGRTGARGREAKTGKSAVLREIERIRLREKAGAWMMVVQGRRRGGTSRIGDSDCEADYDVDSVRKKRTRK